MEYKYGMRLRGFSPMCQPKDGFVRREDDVTGKYYDIIVYNRRLTEKEINNYELYEIKEGNMNYIILQLPVAHPGTFRSYEENEEYNRLPKREDYVCVYIGQIDGVNGEATLNRIYEQLNINHPADYHARSLSVSDVVGLDVDEGKLEWWYVDSFGFKRIWEK